MVTEEMEAHQARDRSDGDRVERNRRAIPSMIVKTRARTSQARHIAAFLLLLQSLMAAQSNGQESTLSGSIHIAEGSTHDGRARMLARGKRPYHSGESLKCSDCHFLHNDSENVLEDPRGVNAQFASSQGQPNPKRMSLKAADPVDLCLRCHDGTPGVPDVVGDDVNELDSRAGGFFDQPGFPNIRGHDLGHGRPRGATSCNGCHGGSIAEQKVTCIDCHNPHGNGNPRNLQWASDPGKEPPFGLFVDPTAVGLQRYERSRVSYGTLNSRTLREVSNLCLDCHHTFSGSIHVDPDGNGIHSRHPSYDSERASPNSIAQGASRGATDPYHWKRGRGSGFNYTDRLKFVVNGAADYPRGTNVDSSSNGVFCLTCHDAHGSSEPFSLTWAVNDGDSSAGCRQCHNMQGRNPEPAVIAMKSDGTGRG